MKYFKSIKNSEDIFSLFKVVSIYNRYLLSVNMNNFLCFNLSIEMSNFNYFVMLMLNVSIFSMLVLLDICDFCLKSF